MTLAIRWFTFLAATCFSSTAIAAVRPNIVVILADDLGYGDIRALNARSRIPTPNLDRLAAEGMTFTDAHSPSSVCTPTRYGLLTGRYCWRTRLKHGVLDGYSRHLIEPGRPTVASFLAAHGYTTCVVGKWHLGMDFSKQSGDPTEIDYAAPVTNGPESVGFEYSFVIPASLDFPPYVFIENGHVVEPPAHEQPAQKFPAFVRRGPRADGFEMQNVLDHLLEKSQAFIRRSAASEKPFFLYFPLTAPHKPVLPHPRFRGMTQLGDYGDFVAQVDWTVGKVVSTLRESDVEEKTFVVFSSDNGSFMFRIDSSDQPDHTNDATIQAFRASEHTANFVYRGTKADIWEAGHRVPFIVRWPGRVAAESECSATICLTDLFATCAELIGQSAPDSAEDSFSFQPLLDGETNSFVRPPVVHHSAAGMFAIRDGDWKLVLGNGSGGREAPSGSPFGRPYQLYRLSDDVSEATNLADQFPELVNELSKKMDAIRAVP